MKQLQRLLSVTIAEPLKERWPPPAPTLLPPAPQPQPPPGPAEAADAAFEACCYFVNDVAAEGKWVPRRQTGGPGPAVGLSRLSASQTATRLRCAGLKRHLHIHRLRHLFPCVPRR